jgi:hypothetical protein
MWEHQDDDSAECEPEGVGAFLSATASIAHLGWETVWTVGRYGSDMQGMQPIALPASLVTQGLGEFNTGLALAGCRPPLTRFQRGLSLAAVDRLDWMDLVEGALSNQRSVPCESARPSHLPVSSSSLLSVQSLTFTHDGERRVYHDGAQPISRRIS